MFCVDVSLEMSRNVLFPFGLGTCIYTSLHEMGFPMTGNSILLPDSYNTIDDCQAECSGGDKSEMACWAVTYDNAWKSCTIHKGINPFTLRLSDALHMPNHSASQRICYIGE